MSAKRAHLYFTTYFDRLCARGVSTTGALVAIARKLAQLAFVLLKTHTDFDPTKLKGTPSA